MMSDAIDRPKLAWLRVKTDADLERIKRHAKAHHVNTYNGPRLDKNDDFIITLGWDDKPDSDWGRFRGNSAAIWFASEELAVKGEALVRKVLWGEGA